MAMLPPLNQITTEAPVVGPPRDAVHRPSIPSTPASASSPWSLASPSLRPGVASHRRVSAAKPSPPSAAFSSPRRATYCRPPAGSVLPASAACEPQPLAPGASTAIDGISRIPREFFVVETHAVLPQTQYPPTQYQSTFVGSGAWETVVFPALTPHTRQQVLCLRNALETMRTRAAAATTATPAATAMLTVEYTEKEWALHSLCFHELARQIKFICREQSELLFEIQSAYDATVARLATLVRRLQQQHDADDTAITALQQQLRVTQDQVQQLKVERAMETDRTRLGGDDRDSVDEDDDAADDEWRAFQRQRRLRMQAFAQDESDDDSDGGGGNGRGRLQRASIVKENTAAARVQQAFTKYQHRKEAHRALQRQEKKDAALDIQRSYRGYRERKRALHHRAVMHTILKRRKEVAAVELLQMNVRAYLIKKRREGTHGGSRDEPTTARAAMLEAQRAAAAAEATAPGPHHALDLRERVTASTPEPAHDDASANDRFAQLLHSMSELAAAFSFLHSRRRHAPKATRTAETTATAVATTRGPEENGAVGVDRPKSGEGDVEDAERSREPHAATTMGVQVEGDEDADRGDQELLDATIRRAEDLMASFRLAIGELRQHDGADETLTKATSTTTLPSSANDDHATAISHGHSGLRGETASLIDALSPATLRFVDDDDDHDHHNAADTLASPRGALDRTTSLDRGLDDDDTDDLDGDSDDATYVDDVLWQAAVFSPRAHDDTDDEASDRARLLRERLATREQQKRHAALKQLIADLYDTIVGRLRELPRARLEKLIQVHASLALSLADGQRLLRGRRHARSSDASSAYEPVRAFVGRIDLKELIRDHFHCHVGLKHLVDAASARVEADVRHFMELDPDVQRFHDYLTRTRSLDDLVFFCLCRLVARDGRQHSSSSSTSRRQPVFHGATLRDVLDADCAMDVAARFFHAGGDDASMIQTDAFVIEPTNEIYTRHLPSHALAQLDAIVRNYVSSVDTDAAAAAEVIGIASDGGRLRQEQHLRATNASHFHAREYNASAPRSPLRQQRDGATSLSSASTSLSNPRWLYFTDLVDLLRRYRSVMRHFHAFVHWTYERFHDAYRQHKQQQQQQWVDTAAPTTAGPPLLEEATFVTTLLPFSLGASDRELRNVFHNALKQRQLQRLMPVRVFVSVVLVLLRNGLLSVTSYAPLQQPVPTATDDVRNAKTLALDGSSSLGAHRRQREETQWIQLALQWRTQERRFQATIERLTAAAEVKDVQAPAATDSATDTDPVTDADREHAATTSQLLQWRNELYELFMRRAGRTHLARALHLYEQLVTVLGRDGGEEAVAFAVHVPETDEHDEGDDDEERASQSVDLDAGAAAAAAVGSPWTISDADESPRDAAEIIS